MRIALAILTFLSFALAFWRWAASRRFPLHRRSGGGAGGPGITVLKPLKGFDLETRRCLESWFAQRYPGSVQILFGVAAESDPVCDVVRELIARHPQTDAQLVICSEMLGANAKVSTLMHLEGQIRHELVVVSDADVRAPEDLLVNLAPLFAQPEIGLASCFYCLANPSTLAMRWEAVAVNADFWSQVLQARGLKDVDFALGAVMAVPRTWLKKIGGFASLADYLADDYQLGQQVARSGGRLVFSPVVVACYESSATWSQVWAHQLRWARTIRICQPLPFFFSILNNATLWPALWGVSLVVFASPWSLSSGLVWPLILIMGSLFFRVATGLQMQRRLTQSTGSLSYWWLIPLSDLLGVATWAMAFWGNKIIWRGDCYRVLSGGKLLKVTNPR